MTDKMMVAQGVANRLFATEKAIDAALGEASGLLGLYLGVDVLAVQEVIQHRDLVRVPTASPVVRGLINLRGQIVTAHRELEQVKLRIGIRSKMMGEHQKDACSTTEIRAIAS